MYCINGELRFRKHRKRGKKEEEKNSENRDSQCEKKKFCMEERLG